MNTLYYTIEALIAPHMRDEDETEWLLNGMEWNPEKCDEITRAFGMLTKLTKNARNGIFTTMARLLHPFPSKNNTRSVSSCLLVG